MSDYSDDGSDAYVYDSDGPLEDDDDSDCLIPANMDKGKQKMGVDSRALSLEDLQNLLTSDIRRVASITGLEEPQPDPASGAAKKNLEKWLFYFDRYNNHELSSKLDQELCDRTEEKMIEVQETSSLSWIEAKFMQKRGQ
ncbi:hypothetical protein EW026_g4065 [Hermanssonia centrifuga]|uniref:Uncharacterized protein n=1 Tax=Hermanssonia centrifuga TaxID=98765 RepID=A0A4S4KIB7_9APHY|nr:hypothetical protein EW026_g4065 [Hermanssonia centrifuga]